MYQARTAADAHGLALHLDGARLWNAAVALGVPPAAIAGPFDTVSVCLSKGLGAPIGSVLVGADDLIARARRWRKVLGGGMRQAGIIAAAGLYAIEHNIDRLATDHANARRLADGLDSVAGVRVSGHATNMVFITFEGGSAAADGARDALGAAGITIRTAGATARLVTHLDVDIDAVDRLVGVLAERAA
jgi:threonine aldolase